MVWDPFSRLSSTQREQLAHYATLVQDINQRVNLLSRGRPGDFETRHLAHSLCLGWREFPPGSTTVDWGSGGGLPGIPLAVSFPGAFFVLVEASSKKVRALKLFVRELGLSNVAVWEGRAEAYPGRAQHAVSRATAEIRILWAWSKRILDLEPVSVSPSVWPPGLLCLKGGEMESEIRALSKAFPAAIALKTDLEALTGLPAFADKCLVQVAEAPGLVGVRGEA